MDLDAAPVAFGPYKILGRLGEGGMCHVFRARKQGADFDIALKLLKEHRRRDDRILDLFVTEADLTLLLRHPNLMRAYDAGEHGGRYFIAMELMEGANLRQLETRCADLGVAIPPDFVLYIVNEVLEGLEAVHTATARSGRPLGLVHRDVTPSNIFISHSGRVVLGDFGIAHIMAYGDVEPGQAVGKLGYISPEAAVGDRIDHRADLYSVAVILWELLAGMPLHTGASDEEVLNHIADNNAPRLRKHKPGAGKLLDNLIAKCLARRAKDRFPTAERMAVALEPCWSTEIGNPRAMACLMAGLFREESHEWRQLHGASVPPPPTARSWSP